MCLSPSKHKNGIVYETFTKSNSAPLAALAVTMSRWNSKVVECHDRDGYHRVECRKPFDTVSSQLGQLRIYTRSSGTECNRQKSI